MVGLLLNRNRGWWLLVDHQEQLVLSVPDVLNIVGWVITLMLGGSSVGKMDCTGKLRQDWLIVFILYRGKLAKIH